MTTKTRCVIGGAILLAVALGMASCLWGGCSTPQNNPLPTANSNGIPHLALVEPSIWRGGQPTDAGWVWLKEAGVSNVVKLNTFTEGEDAFAYNRLKMKLQYEPMDTMEQLWTGPDPASVKRALGAISPGTFVHCEHGQDRTGLIIGLHRIEEGTNAAAAWQEMTNHGFHPALLGLTKYWNTHSHP